MAMLDSPVFVVTTRADDQPSGCLISFASQTSVPAGGQFNVNINVSDPNGDPMRYNLMLTSKYVNKSTGLQYATFTQTGTGSFMVTAPQKVGVWKVYVYVYDGQGNVGIETKSFKVV